MSQQQEADFINDSFNTWLINKRTHRQYGYYYHSLPCHQDDPTRFKVCLQRPHYLERRFATIAECREFLLEKTARFW